MKELFEDIKRSPMDYAVVSGWIVLFAFLIAL